MIHCLKGLQGCLIKFANKEINFKNDIYAYGKSEYWATASETWKNKKDDCDGINGFIYVVARLSGISPLQIWSCIGDVSLGGHYWNLYFSFKRDKWFIIDGTFYPDFSPIGTRNMFVLDGRNYLNIDFIFNEDFIFTR